MVNKTTDLDDQRNVKPDKVFHKTGGKRTKNRTPSDNEEEVGNKIVLVSRPYNIDLQFISDLSAVGAMAYLPEQAFEQGEDAKFSREKLLGLLCLQERGSLLTQEWFTNEYPFPDMEKYCTSTEAFEYWKVLSLQDDPTISDMLQEWVSHFSDYKIFV